MAYNNRAALYKTLFYADIFDYPLSSYQLWRFLMVKTPVSKEAIKKFLAIKDSSIVKKEDFYVLKGRELLIDRRNKIKELNWEKQQIAKKISKIFSFFPTVLFVGISGGLALYNANEEDDIDIFIVTRRKTMWMTRVLLVSILFLLGRKRKPGNKMEKNKICLNMFISEEKLTLPNYMQNMYVAHEVVQLKPLVNKEHIYERFLSANKWVLSYMANGFTEKQVLSMQPFPQTYL